MHAVDIGSLNKKFGNYTALNNVNVSVNAGEFVSILGPSGCGKTTLLRIIAGLELPDSGHLIIGGRNVTTYPVWKRNIGLVFQNFALWPHLSVFRNVSMGLELRKIEKSDIVARVTDALKLVQLDHLAERLPSQLSGGQQQRVALARAIVLKPEVLLLDEPLSSLDKNLRQDMQVELKSLQRTLGLTTVFVTHDQEEALSLSDRIVVMNKGVVEQIGTPDDVYNRPQSRFVARFVGETTFFSGEVIDENGRPVLRSDAGVRIPLNKAPVSHGNATAFVRPEWVGLERKPKATTPHDTVGGRVHQVMFFGSTRDYLVEIPGALVRVKSVGGQENIEAGEEVILRLVASALPAETDPA